MATMKIKKGDMVKVIAGKDKGKEGKVLSVKDGKVVVEGINQVTKHAKPSQANPQGGIIKKKQLLTFLTLCTLLREKLQESVLKLMVIKKYV